MATAVLVVLVLIALLAGASVWAWRRGHIAYLQRLVRRGAVALARTELPPAAEIVVPGELPVVQPRAVVLVHGILGFDQIRVPGLKVDYFRGIARHLDSCGVVVHTVKLPK